MGLPHVNRSQAEQRTFCPSIVSHPKSLTVMRVTSILPLALVSVFRPCAAVTDDAVNAQCYTNNVQFDSDVVANPLFGDDGTSTPNTRDRTLSDCLLDCSLISD